jgi:uncharacterized protein involved in type VI secretion and phage assembly
MNEMARGDSENRHFGGVTLGQVVNNVDETGRGRVQVRIAWHGDVQLWARVAVLVAGDSRGTFFIPQVGDEVLVAFESGDLNSPYVIGSLWNGLDSPPTTDPQDAVNKQMIRTRTGHQIAIDDSVGEITITSAGGQKIVVDAEKVEMTAGSNARITLDTTGQITLKSSQGITLDAPTVSIQGTTLDLKGKSSASLNGGSRCSIQAGLVSINS